MIEFVAKNVVVGLIIILINIIPLISKKYKLIPITALISLALILIANYLK